MISTRGLPPILAIGLIERQRDQFETSLRNEPVAKREIDAFRQRISKIDSVQDLLKDREVCLLEKGMEIGELQDPRVRRTLFRHQVAVAAVEDSCACGVWQEEDEGCEGDCALHQIAPDWIRSKTRSARPKSVV